MRVAYSYLRFSQTKQELGQTERRQIGETLAICQEQGWFLDETARMADRGIPAYRGRNAKLVRKNTPGLLTYEVTGKGVLAKFIRQILDGFIRPGAVLIEESIDRLSRDQPNDGFKLLSAIIESGIAIQTVQPRRLYGQLDTLARTELSILLERAHEESATKAYRIGKSWEERRHRMAERKMTGKAPLWLRLSDDKTTFIPIPERVEVLNRMFTMAKDGLGVPSIVKTLNTDTPSWGKSPGWTDSYVRLILAGRAVLGEFQPCKMVNGKQEPFGEPIKGYYPQVVPDDLYYAAKNARSQRRTVRGRNDDTRHVTNLFTGLVFDARDGFHMHVNEKNRRKKLVSDGAVNRAKGSKYTTVDLEAFERTFLRYCVEELDPAAFLTSVRAEQEEIESLTGRLIDVNNRIEAINGRISVSKDIGELLNTLERQSEEKKRIKERLDELKAKTANHQADMVTGFESLIQMLDTAEDKTALRVKIKARIRVIIEGGVPGQLNHHEGFAVG